MAAPLRVIEAEFRRYRHTWRASVITSFVNPVLMLSAMGVGLGSLVDRQGGPGGLPYLVWLAPGLLAATAMQTAAGESTWPVMAAIRWVKSYDAALATPLGVDDLVVGQLGWLTFRVAQVSLVFALVMIGFGAVDAGPGLAAVAPAILTGVALGAPIMAYTSWLEEDTGLSSLFRFGIIPLFLFSGTFFPISQLPDWLEPVAVITPLWHGVELSRAVALGVDTTLPWWLHTGILVSFVSVGTLAARWLLGRRLIK